MLTESEGYAAASKDTCGGIIRDRSLIGGQAEAGRVSNFACCDFGGRSVNASLLCQVSI